MDERVIVVNMAQLEVSGRAGDVLTALGLGSCVAVCAYDRSVRLGGMVHVVLPSSAIARPKDSRAKFADVGVPRLVEEMEKRGATRRGMRVAVIGGANVLASANHGGAPDIGRRNAAAVRAALESEGLSSVEGEVGGKVSRTARLRVANGEVTVRTARAAETVVAALGREDE